MQARNIVRATFQFITLLCALSACGSSTTPNKGSGTGGTPSGTGGTSIAGAGGGLSSGTGGVAAGTGGFTGVAGTAGTTPGTGGIAAGTGGIAAGTGGIAAGTGGIAAGTGGIAAGTGGIAAGTGGTTAGGMTVEQCTASVMAGGTTVTACETCLCQPNNCQNELVAVGNDAKANALVKCTTTMNCQGSCCLCGFTETTCSVTSYGTGPCAAAFETAAGLTPGAGVLVNGAMLAPACKVTAGTSCSKAAALGQCVMNKCATECPPKGPTCAIPPPAM